MGKYKPLTDYDLHTFTASRGSFSTTKTALDHKHGSPQVGKSRISGLVATTIRVTPGLLSGAGSL